jgi:hypothetical protein
MTHCSKCFGLSARRSPARFAVCPNNRKANFSMSNQTKGTKRMKRQRIRIMQRAALAIAIVLAASSAHAANIWAKPRVVYGGGTVIFMTGEIELGDEQVFAGIADRAVPPVYVAPSGPGGNVKAALAIADMIALRGYNTAIGNGYMCASACALIWSGGYANHAIVHNNSRLYFHSCASEGEDDWHCNAVVIDHLRAYGFTMRQAEWAIMTPHENTLLATKGLAAAIGFRWQWLWQFPGVEDSCRARLCMVVP